MIVIGGRPKVAAVVTFWHWAQGGYWEAAAYHDGVSPERGQPVRRENRTLVYKTGMNEVGLALDLATELAQMGYDEVRMYTREGLPPTVIVWVDEHPISTGDRFRSQVSGQQGKEPRDIERLPQDPR